MAFTQQNRDNSGLWCKEKTINCSIGVRAEFPGLATETLVHQRETSKRVKGKPPKTRSRLKCVQLAVDLNSFVTECLYIQTPQTVQGNAFSHPAQSQGFNTILNALPFPLQKLLHSRVPVGLVFERYCTTLQRKFRQSKR